MESKVGALKLAHVGFGTENFEQMKSWWQLALGADLVHENEDMALLSYDEELTRVAIVRQQGRKRSSRGPADHVAFEFAGLDELLARYERLRDSDVRPYWSIRHRSTTSLYYRDPDGNTAELFVANYRDGTRLRATLAEPRSGPGTPFDPESALDRLRRGDPEDEILNPERPHEGASR